MVCLDTTFLIDLLREGHAGSEGAARRKLGTMVKEGERVCTTMVNVAELFAGLAIARDPHDEERILAKLLGTLEILPFDLDAARKYGLLYGQLRVSGGMVGGLDLMIAAIATSRGERLLTRNVDDFSRIPLLSVETY